MNADYYRNKHVLGELTLGDLLDIVDFHGEFSIGKSWLPISRAAKSKSGKWLGLFMDSSSSSPETMLPIESKVTIQEGIVRVLKAHGDRSIPEVRIRLDSFPQL